MPESPNPHAWKLADLQSVQKNGFRVMSTFACGGGSSMGYKRAGFEVVAANDIDPVMAEHYKRNIAPSHYFLCPIGDLTAKNPDGSYKMPLPPELEGLDVLDGSPPCSNFSPAGSREKAWGKKKQFREGQAEQVLSDLFFDYLDLVARLRPVVSIAENVQGMLLGNAKGYVRMIMARYKEIGYRPQLFLVNAADCGVPQARRRVFFLAVREDIAAAAKLDPITLTFRHRHVSTSEACADIQDLTPAEVEETAPHDTDLKWWAVTRPGEKYAAARQRAGADNALWNWIRHPAHRPACTLVAAHQCMKHWTVCRSLSFREFKRLGSFPDDYWAKDPQTGKYLIGMSVPPKMTEAVAREVLRCWLVPAAKAIRRARAGA